MDYKLINCDSIIRKITNIDTLFHGNYCVDPYQNCAFGCQYCDSSFDKTIYVKKNIIDVLKKELQTMKNGRIIIGSVHDPYQNIEKKFNLTKHVLETLRDYNFSCHILTKSPLVLRDINIISDLSCLVTISISSMNDKVVHIFESEVPSPADRFQTIKKLRTLDIKAGLALIPILPYITESEIEPIVNAAQNVDAQYLLHKYLELKGDQQTHFKNLIKIHYPHLLTKYDALYQNNIRPEDKYIQELNKIFSKYCKKVNISGKLPL
jgi:DNA repair photolyase